MQTVVTLKLSKSLRVIFFFPIIRCKVAKCFESGMPPVVWVNIKKKVDRKKNKKKVLVLQQKKRRKKKVRRRKGVRCRSGIRFEHVGGLFVDGIVGGDG